MNIHVAGVSVELSFAGGVGGGVLPCTVILGLKGWPFWPTARYAL